MIFYKKAFFNIIFEVPPRVQVSRTPVGKFPNFKNGKRQFSQNSNILTSRTPTAKSPSFYLSYYTTNTYRRSLTEASINIACRRPLRGRFSSFCLLALLITRKPNWEIWRLARLKLAFFQFNIWENWRLAFLKLAFLEYHLIFN